MKPFLTILLFAAAVQAESPVVSQQYQATVGQLLQQVQQGSGGRGATAGVPALTLRDLTRLTPAWWTNANLVAQLGLTDTQKVKVQAIYENHKQNIASDSDALTKQEAQLGTLLAADPVDHSAVLGQIDRVAQARADLERSNSAMTLEMREVLTAAQWAKLQAMPPFRVYFNWLGQDVISTPFGPVPRTQPPAAQRGGQRQQ